ncbi:hypothetical protein TIFTF001_035361 [Ficus carica]|uniref:Protein kinase domain-containing protein n=1 Tax=Ficus carica TaxID=3494 RepID=A0AA88E1F3_FICCA|nr:hypothetical protein TIFTF001_035361 [Ficus carica]
MESRCLCFPGLMKEDKEQRYFLENGGTLLEELVSSCKGRWRCNPIRTYSAKEIEEATDHFKSFIKDDSFSKWYKGTLDDRPVLIKKYVGCYKNEAYRDIAVGSQMSSHKNVLKLLGCCLEFPHPALVYEYVEPGHLNPTGVIASTGLSLSWKMRLKVAKDIANAITYLHTSFDRPIIHRDIIPTNIVLDKDFNPKLCEFSFCITIPEGETQVKENVLHWTCGFLDPDYAYTSFITEHTDVYSFGILLCVFLTGQKAFDINRPENKDSLPKYITQLIEKEGWMEVVDPKILEGNIGEEQQLQLKAFLELALKCTERKREDRPLMIDVAKELVRIEKSVSCPSRLA